MLNIRLVRGSQFLHGEHEGTLDLESSRDALCQLLAEGAKGAGSDQGSYALLFDVRDAVITLSMADVWTLLQDIDECDPGFDGRLGLLDDWDKTFDRMQFFEASADQLGFQARAFINFEKAVNWLWDERNSVEDLEARKEEPTV